MKKEKLFLKFCAFFLIASVVLFPSCSQDEVSPQNEELTSQQLIPSNEEIISYLVDAFNFHVEDIKISTTKDLIIVEGDMLFSKNEILKDMLLAENQNGPSLRVHRKSTYLVGSTPRTITINLAGLSSVAWRTAITQAASEWNSLSGDISFTVINTSQTTSGGINVRTAFASDLGLDEYAVAAALLPTSNGNPGLYFYVLDETLLNSTTASQKKFAAVHELGHAIGFEHTDTAEGVKLWIYAYNCDNTTDNFSVMRPVVRNWGGFSQCDQAAFNAIY
ncbi:MAG: M57 family metalloprotease [Candidatus Peribacteria bacterium]|jgi:hypothetical protein|nr:M57 family metalloprotease [Candidatus Peribacteria bacterium]